MLCRATPTLTAVDRISNSRVVSPFLFVPKRWTHVSVSQVPCHMICSLQCCMSGANLHMFKCVRISHTLKCSSPAWCVKYRDAESSSLFGARLRLTSLTPLPPSDSQGFWYGCKQ